MNVVNDGGPDMVIEQSQELAVEQRQKLAIELGQERSLLHQSFRRLLRDPLGTAGAVIVLGLILVAVFAPLISPYDPLKIGSGEPLAAPSVDHLMGTDQLGRDTLSRIIHGTRISFSVSAFAAILAFLMAGPLGMAAGYLGGAVDSVIARVFDSIFAFPGILVGIGLAAALGPSLINVTIAVGIVSIPTLGRITRVSVLAQRSEDYVLAARALGVSQLRIVVRHILPNVVPAILVQLALIMANAVLLEAAFSFLGLGSKPPTPSWGLMLNKSRSYLTMTPWPGIFPGIAVTLMIFGLNSFADGIQKVMNPRLVNR